MRTHSIRWLYASHHKLAEFLGDDPATTSAGYIIIIRALGQTGKTQYNMRRVLWSMRRGGFVASVILSRALFALLSHAH